VMNQGVQAAQGPGVNGAPFGASNVGFNGNTGFASSGFGGSNGSPGMPNMPIMNGSRQF